MARQINVICLAGALLPPSAAHIRYMYSIPFGIRHAFYLSRRRVTFLIPLILTHHLDSGLNRKIPLQKAETMPGGGKGCRGKRRRYNVGNAPNLVRPLPRLGIRKFTEIVPFILLFICFYIYLFIYILVYSYLL